MKPFVAMVESTKNNLKRVYPSFGPNEAEKESLEPLNAEYADTEPPPSPSTLPRSWHLFRNNRPCSTIVCIDEEPAQDETGDVEGGRAEDHEPAAGITMVAVPVECSQASCTSCQVHPRG